MKVLILGASGLLGQALMREWKGDEVVGLSVEDVDIRDAASVRGILEKERPACIVLAAAYTDVDGCEGNPELAFAVNRDGAVHVARAADDIGANLLFLSSDYVFDGKKDAPYAVDDTRNPQSVYGRTKAEAEVQLLESTRRCCIVRTAWLFGTGGKCFPDTILKAAATRPLLEVVSDQRGCPTYSIDLARAIVQLCRKGASGIVHVTNGGNCSWFEFAREIIRQAGLPTEVRPISTGQIARPAPRPAYSVLSPASMGQFEIEMPNWQDALQRYLRERRG